MMEGGVEGWQLQGDLSLTLVHKAHAHLEPESRPFHRQAGGTGSGLLLWSPIKCLNCSGERLSYISSSTLNTNSRATAFKSKLGMSVWYDCFGVEGQGGGAGRFGGAGG